MWAATPDEADADLRECLRYLSRAEQVTLKFVKKATPKRKDFDLIMESSVFSLWGGNLRLMVKGSSQGTF